MARKAMRVRSLCTLCRSKWTDIHAGYLYEQEANITFMIQADMLGYHADNEPPQLGLPATFVHPSVHLDRCLSWVPLIASAR